MANSGIKFDRFYAAAPVCSQLEEVCPTGRHPFRCSIYYANTGHMKEKELTLAEIMKIKGYRTGHFGKWHLGTLTTKIKMLIAEDQKEPSITHLHKIMALISVSLPNQGTDLEPYDCSKKFSNGTKRRKWWNPVTDTKNTEHYGTHYQDQNSR